MNEAPKKMKQNQKEKKKHPTTSITRPRIERGTLSLLSTLYVHPKIFVTGAHHVPSGGCLSSLNLT
jgi:hypothetical protein